jgi:hypothetical protein
MTIVISYEAWLDEVRAALDSLKMPMDDWQSVWRYDFHRAYDAGATPAKAAEGANRYWWREQNRAMKQDCNRTPGCWLPRNHQGECQARASCWRSTRGDERSRTVNALCKVRDRPRE